jgi:hypothetical protein
VGVGYKYIQETWGTGKVVLRKYFLFCWSTKLEGTKN